MRAYDVKEGCASAVSALMRLEGSTCSGKSEGPQLHGAKLQMGKGAQ